MPGKPQRKSRRIDEIAEQFAVLATDLDDLLPACYRFSGQPSTGDHGADAWSAAALNELRDILRDHADLA